MFIFSAKNWNIEEITGYKPQTTFYQDFSIADAFGCAAVKDTYNRAFAEWKSNYVYLTELVMVLNWKIHEHIGSDNEKAQLYDQLWQEADAYACDNLAGEELEYFFSTTD